MVEQRFIDKIESLRHNTYSRITDLQKNLCPMVKQVYLNLQFEYWYEGYKYNIWEDDTHLYAVNEIPYCYDNELKNTTFTDTLDNLVNEGKVWPFLLFIDGYVIRWSDITVIHDYDYTYLKISNIVPDTSVYAGMVVFPLNVHQIRYGEDKNILTTPDRKGFYFGTDGKRLEKTDFVDIYLRFEILDPNIYYKEVEISLMPYSTLVFEDLPDGYVPTLDNIITFATDGSYNHGGASSKFGNIYNGSYGMFNILNNNVDVKWAILMYNTKDTDTESSYLYTKADDLDKASIVKLLTRNPKSTSEEIWNDIITPLIKIFDFDHDQFSTYEENINSATKYITNYDFSLWKDVFSSNTNMKSLTYTGTEFKNLSDEKGYVHFSRKHGELITDCILMFVNHKLYDYIVDVTYNTNTINIPTFGIVDDDHIEIVMYTNCNNNVLDIKVDDPNTAVYIHPEYDLENCDIMSSECPDASYDVEPRADDRVQYIVKCTYTVDENSNYKIDFEKSDYYGKALTIVPKNQFRYYQFKEKAGKFSFTLPTQFNYCHDENRYLVFINGRKIDRTEYSITIMNEDRPFDKLVLYIATVLDEGDYIDVFYVPEPIVEKYKQDSIPKSGLLLLEDTDTSINYPTTYPLSKSTSMVFINGLKVNSLDIKDISLNCMLIGVDKYERNEDGTIKRDGYGNPIVKRSYVGAVDNVTILEYITGNKEVAGYLKGLYDQIPSGEAYDPSKIDFNKSASDSWKELIKTLLNKYAESGIEYAGLEKIFGNIFELEDPESDFKDNFTSLRSALYDAVIEFYLSRDDTTTGDKFVYDYERDYFESDEDGTKQINLMPDKDKIADYDVDSNVASTEDVYSGKKFTV